MTSPDRPASASADGLSRLSAEHREVEGWLADYESSETIIGRQRTAARLCAWVRHHLRLQQAVVHPAFVSVLDELSLYREDYTEHLALLGLVLQLETTDVLNADSHAALVRQLGRLIRTHIEQEESPGGLFDQIRHTPLDLGELDARLRAFDDSRPAA